MIKIPRKLRFVYNEANANTMTVIYLMPKIAKIIAVFMKSDFSWSGFSTAEYCLGGLRQAIADLTARYPAAL